MRVEGLGCTLRVGNLGFRVEGLRLRVYGMVWGLGLRTGIGNQWLRFDLDDPSGVGDGGVGGHLVPGLAC